MPGTGVGSDEASPAGGEATSQEGVESLPRSGQSPGRPDSTEPGVDQGPHPRSVGGPGHVGPTGQGREVNRGEGPPGNPNAQGLTGENSGETDADDESNESSQE